MPRPRRAPRRAKAYIELEGQEDVRKAFARLEFSALRGAKEAVDVSSDEIEREAKSRVAVLSGKTRDSITRRVRDFGLSATIGSGYFNARFEEQGTTRAPARPFLNPAFQLVRPKYLERLKRALGIAVKEAS